MQKEIILVTLIEGILKMNETNSKKSLTEPWFWPKMLFLVKSVLIKIDSEINKKCMFVAGLAHDSGLF